MPEHININSIIPKMRKKTLENRHEKYTKRTDKPGHFLRNFKSEQLNKTIARKSNATTSMSPGDDNVCVLLG